MDGNCLNNVRVLLVEDERTCRDVLTVMLKKAGATVAGVTEAEQALQVLDDAPFDVILADIVLPGMDGIELLRQIRKRDFDLPVLLITGHGSLQSAAEAVKLGAQDYILKPICDSSRFVKSVWQAVDRFRLVARNRQLQDELRKSEEIFRTLFNNANDAIFLHNMGNNRAPELLDRVNDPACARLGYSRRELTSRSLIDLVSPEHRDAAIEQLQKGLQKGSCTFETVLQTVGGGKIPMEISCHIFTLQGRKLAISIARDISERREMESQLANVTENERRFLGREIHDVLCQNLTSIAMLSSVIKSAVSGRNATLRSDAAVINRLAARALSSAKGMARGLFPIALDSDNLKTALKELAVHCGETHGVRCSVACDDGVDIPDKSIALNLYRIAQEAVNNAVCHGKAKKISISLKRTRRGTILTVMDNGRGFSSARRKTGGMGLHIMEHRARLIGAALNITTGKHRGTSVECIWQ